MTKIITDKWSVVYSPQPDRYTFTWNDAFIEITDAWPYDTGNGGPWNPAKSYANLYNDNQYWEESAW